MSAKQELVCVKEQQHQEREMLQHPLCEPLICRVKYINRRMRWRRGCHFLRFGDWEEEEKQVTSLLKSPSWHLRIWKPWEDSEHAEEQ